MSHGILEAIWKKRSHGGPMDAVGEAALDVRGGMTGDANFAGPRPITLISSEAWDRAVKALGVSVDPSARRANLLVRGVSLQDTEGRVLAVGSCRIHILGETRPCKRMDEAAVGLRDALSAEWRGGAYGKVITGGRIRTGDSVRWVPAEESTPEENEA